jgi:uncharacterized protein YndB with AHSA1/START domain
MSVEHSTFVIERTYDASPARVYAAWSEPDAKAHWFGGGAFALDFRVGGRETNDGGPEGGPHYTYEATYRDIVSDERIVYTYVMHVDDALMSVSLATVEFEPEGEGTRLTLTEHGAFLDGLDTSAQREHGTGELLDQLGRTLAGATAGT